MSDLSMTKIVLIGEWITYPDGAVVSVPSYKACEMVERGVAKFVDETKQKSVDKPPMNKMITVAPVKKAGRPKKIKQVGEPTPNK